MSLDRLIDLAKRTGDRLIVHNPLDNQDVVIMSVDEYEYLVDGNREVRNLSSNQLLDQINRDISVWRNNKEQDEDWDRTSELEDELWDEEMSNFSFDPFDDPWHKAGDILGKRYSVHDFEEDEDLFDDEGEMSVPNFDFGPAESLENFSPYADESEENNIGFPFDIEPPKEEVDKSAIVYAPKEEEWVEEPLSDEPVFYEEPV